MKKLKILLYGFCCISLVFTVLLSIMASVKASELVNLEEKISKLEDDNRSLSAGIIANSSLTQAWESAKSIGLSESRVVIYLNDDVSVAALQ